MSDTVFSRANVANPCRSLHSRVEARGLRANRRLASLGRDGFRPHPGPVVAPRARRERALARSTDPLRLRPPTEVSFVPRAMTETATITTDSRPSAHTSGCAGWGAPASLSRSSEDVWAGARGGAGSQLVTFEEAESLGLPVVGYLAYDHIAVLEPTVELPDDGHGFPDSRPRRRGDPRALRSRRRHGRGARGRRGGGRGTVRGRDPVASRDARHRGQPRAPSRPRAVRGDGAGGRAPHRGRRRVPVRAVAAGRATDRRVPARRVPRAPPRHPSPYLFLLELSGIALVGSSPERLVACEDGRASLCPIAGTTEPTEGDVERLLPRRRIGPST